VFSVSAEQSNAVKITFDSSISTTSQTFTWQLSNALSGTEVASGQIASSGEVLNFGQFPTGIYLLQINTGNGRTETQKVVLK
jgi:hypothetical protein